MQTIRQRGRDPAAIHDILSQVDHQSPSLLHALLESNLEELSEFIQVSERFGSRTSWLSRLLTTVSTDTQCEQGQGLDSACVKFGQLTRRWYDACVCGVR